MVRRRAPEVSVDAAGFPAHLTSCRIADWTTGDPHDLNCDDGNGRCLLHRGAHDWSCSAATARRRWYDARALSGLLGLPHGRPR